MLLSVCLALAMGAGAQSFGTLRARMAGALGARPVHPHLIGFFTFFTPVRVAVFSTEVERPLETAARTLGPQWRRVVRTRDRQDGDETRIYVRVLDHGRSFRMLILNRDGDDDQVQMVTMKVRAGDLLREIGEHSRHQNY
ncbi:MAG: hypothetical protein ACRD1F_09640 [Terriglobales bacterium]